MTRKHYVALAAAFARTRPLDARVIGQGSDGPLRTMRNQWLNDRDAIASALAADPTFDRPRFVAATESRANAEDAS